MRALHGDFTDGRQRGNTPGGPAVAIAVAFFSAIFVGLSVDFVQQVAEDNAQGRENENKENRIDNLFATWEASGASQIDLEFWQTLLDAAKKGASKAQMNTLVHQARAINETDKENVPDELLAIIEEYAN